MLRKATERTIDGLWDRIGVLISTVLGGIESKQPRSVRFLEASRLKTSIRFDGGQFSIFKFCPRLIVKALVINSTFEFRFTNQTVFA
jgi:hypothetical protein